MNQAATQPVAKVQTLAELRAFLRDRAADLRARHTMTVDGVFGSFARGDQTDESDVDLLVSFKRLPSLWEFYAIERELGEVLGRQVHLVHHDRSEAVRRICSELVPL